MHTGAHRVHSLSHTMPKKDFTYWEIDISKIKYLPKHSTMLTTEKETY